MKISYAQSPTENTCAFIALLNALSFYDIKIPHMRYLNQIVKDIKLEYGTSPQDIFVIADKLNLHLAVIKNIKQSYINTLNKKIPILVSCNFLRANIPEHKGIYIPDTSTKIKVIDFKLPNIKILPPDNIEGLQKYGFYDKYAAAHTVCITKYDQITDSFLCTNLCGGKNYWCNFNSMYFMIGHNKEQWDSSYIILTKPIKIAGNDILVDI